MTQNQIKLFIVDNDPIFRLGLVSAIAIYPDFTIIGQGDASYDTIRQLTRGLVLNILVVGVGWEGRELKYSSLEFCRQLRQIYPELPLFLLLGNLKSKQLAEIESWQVGGYCYKGSDSDTAIAGLRTVAYGEVYRPLKEATVPRWWQITLSRVSKSGRQQLEDNLEAIERELAREDLSDWDRVFLIGRKRELLAARWVATKLTSEAEAIAPKNNNAIQLADSSDKPVLAATQLAIAPIFKDAVTAEIFNLVVSDIQLGLVNRTQVTLEIDILQSAKKQELLYTILEYLNKTLEKLRGKTELNFAINDYLIEVWQWVTENFLVKHFGSLTQSDRKELSIFFSQESISINKNIFNHCYSVSELFAYLLGEKALVVDNVVYRSEAPEVVNRARQLLHNLIINLANATIVVILNNFSDLEIFKYNLYQIEYKSSREIARFRNDLVWRYRQEIYWDNPQNIFESRYRLFILNNGRIRTLFIYAPRKQELELLRGLPWLATILIETRDAIAPRLRAVVSFLGSGVVFVLTQVIGRGIGLIGKGIIQGIGSTIKDIPYNNKK
jgi:DNA-binding NarL/FixJ family response regulator